MQLVMDGLKLQPCSPGFVDGRDAILLADQVANGGANQCLIWEAFAKRGLGYSASQGSNGSVTDGTEAFDLAPECSPMRLDAPSPGVAGAENCFDVTGAPPGGTVRLILGLNEGKFVAPICDNAVSILSPRLRDTGTADAAGNVTLCTTLPGAASGRTLRAQAVDTTAPGCLASNVDVTTY